MCGLAVPGSRRHANCVHSQSSGTGATAGEILEDERLVQEDIKSCLLFASRSLEAMSFLSSTGGTP
jgi:hypothetical protein